MLRFLLKKTFYDYLDKFIYVLAINCLLLVLVFITILSIQIINAYYIVPIIIFFIFFHIISALFIFFINNKFKLNIKAILKKSIIPACFISSVNILVVVFGFTAINYYFSKTNYFYTVGFFCFWLLLFWFFGTFYFIPILVKNTIGLFGGIKKSFLLFFNNLLTSILTSILFIIFTFTTVVLIFGTGFALILLNNTYKIILLKQKYIQNNPEKKINWNLILIDEKRKLGHRSIKNIIFPWK